MLFPTVAAAEHEAFLPISNPHRDLPDNENTAAWHQLRGKFPNGDFDFSARETGSVITGEITSVQHGSQVIFHLNRSANKILGFLIEGRSSTRGYGSALKKQIAIALTGAKRVLREKLSVFFPPFAWRALMRPVP